MAKVSVVLGRVSALVSSGPMGVPVMDGEVIGKQVVTVSGSNVASSVECASSDGDGGKRQIWEITGIDTACWVRFSGAASEGNDFYVPIGQSRWFGAKAGQIPNVLNV